ncbi:F0F1 ATP synthase subunit A [Mesoplasma photuris]|uniref:F0F1 ATP synthase subunit A n=1 Tax=Mesoplasma photuris TaxID=217731 RepID=UPI001FDEA5C6|nr:F0F1 ATP synthase subunit A [Mesoplasma photuris]
MMINGEAEASIGDKISENFMALSPQLFGILLTAVIICSLSIIYNVKIRGHKDGEKMNGYLVLVEMFVTSIENLVVEIMGKKYRKLTPYAMYIILYIIVGSLIQMIGIESPTSSFTVTLAMGFVTFVLIYYFGFKYQKLAYLKRYVNPIEIFTQFTPLFSIAFRLFGNLLGGSIILGLLYGLFIGFQSSWAGVDSIVGNATGDQTHWLNWDFWNGAENPEAFTMQYKYWWSGLNIFTTIITPLLHMFFDMFDGVLQSVVFTMLTLSYWSEAMGEEEDEEHTSYQSQKNTIKIETRKA